jgi:hypothetical protein
MTIEHKTRIVTPEQYREGYVEKIGDRLLDQRFKKIRTLPDGNILVKEPELSGRPLFPESH